MNKANIKISASEKLAFISGLGKMLEGGIAIPDAIDALLEGTKKDQKKVLQMLKADLAEGRTISESLAKFPKSFDPITTSLISTGEKSGNLEKNLNQLSANLTADIELSGKIKAAVAYPVFVIAIFFMVLIMILVFVIPRITTVFLRLKLELPLPTKILIVVSSQLRENTVVFVSLVLLALLAVTLVFKKKSSLIFNLLANLPVLSNLVTQIDLARFTRSLNLMLSASIPITEALASTKNVVYRKNIKLMIENCQKSVESGKNISDTLKKYPKIIPPIMTKMIEAGEKSGSLEKSMIDLSSYFNGKIDSSIKTLTILLEPVLLVIIGVLIGGIMLSIITPIYNLIGKINPR